MTSRLIMIAHAETEATRRASFPADEPVTRRGHAAAGWLRPALPAFGAAWCGPARAARDTAAALGCEAAVDEALGDLHCGGWRGQSLSDVAASDPDGLAAWFADPEFTGHGGESIAGLVDRVATWLAARRTGRGSGLAVTHAAVVRCAVLATLRAPPSGFWRLDVQPLAIAEFGSDGSRWALRRISGPDA